MLLKERSRFLPSFSFIYILIDKVAGPIEAKTTIDQRLAAIECQITELKAIYLKKDSESNAYKEIERPRPRPRFEGSVKQEQHTDARRFSRLLILQASAS
jgi:hypothetical protein